MRYEVLGPLRVGDTDGQVVITSRKTETVLAVLLARMGQVVSVDDLVRELWPADPPQRARDAVYVYVSQLRKLLTRPGEPDPVITRAPGYVLWTPPRAVDFQALQEQLPTARAMMRERRYEEACELLERIVALWRGPVLAGLQAGPVVNTFAAWLQELQLECSELLVESKLMLSRDREVVSQLRCLIREHPLQESFYAQLMLALWRSGRQAEALGVYHSARDTLNRELGLEPGCWLRNLQRTILEVRGEGPARRTPAAVRA
ncbi:BTAD domain-containing putative transcriptional regulator [Kitasatospora sp. NPDC059146]|uniref:AfsR/SARP family transcriptional regulator n=1 Tax=unclassified Kitasatospora TaxID=2633591 RepID=UPI0036ADE47B